MNLSYKDLGIKLKNILWDKFFDELKLEKALINSDMLIKLDFLLERKSYNL